MRADGMVSVKKDTYICSLHFIGENGPTTETPDPVIATATPSQVSVVTAVYTSSMPSVESVRNNDKKCRFFTGLSWLQFMCLWNFLGPAKEKLTYWNRKPLKDEEKSPKKRAGNKRSLSPLNECLSLLLSA